MQRPRRNRNRFLTNPDNYLLWKNNFQIKKQLLLPVMIPLSRVHREVKWIGPDIFDFHDGVEAFKVFTSFPKEGGIFGIAEPISFEIKGGMYRGFIPGCVWPMSVPYQHIRHWYEVLSMELITGENIDSEEKESINVVNSEYFANNFKGESYNLNYFFKYKIKKIL